MSGVIRSSLPRLELPRALQAAHRLGVDGWYCSVVDVRDCHAPHAMVWIAELCNANERLYRVTQSVTRWLDTGVPSPHTLITANISGMRVLFLYSPGTRYSQGGAGIAKLVDEEKHHRDANIVGLLIYDTIRGI